jgi:NADPH:quinone reductase-like Zn-dependent oxidoreductase
VVPAERLYHLPAGVDPVEAVAVLHPAATAYLSLFRHGGLRPTEILYVAGAAGNVGTVMTSLARAGGARVLADGGRIVLMAGADQRLTLPAGPPYTHDRGILGFVISLASTADLAEAAAVLNDRLAAGDLPVRVRVVWPLERAAEAHRAVERGERGRTVLRVAPAEPS